MKSEFKHPQIFADLLVLCQMYYPMHSNLPRAFRQAVGEQVLQELTTCLRSIVLANSSEKTTPAGRSRGALQVQNARAGIEVVRGYWLLAWKLKLLSHGALAELSQKLEAISRQAAKWQQWFEREEV